MRILRFIAGVNGAATQSGLHPEELAPDIESMDCNGMACSRCRKHVCSANGGAPRKHASRRPARELVRAARND
jgi:hypothetical protein